MRVSRLPKGGENLFQSIKRVTDEAQQRGVKIIKLSIGQPSGTAFESAQRTAADAVMSKDEGWHEYQDNKVIKITDFAKRFVAPHLLSRTKLDDNSVLYLPIPGIKSMLGIVIQACGSDLRIVATTTKPGYPTPKDQALLQGKIVFEPAINPANNFLFDPRTLAIDGLSTQVGLVMTNYPHNPSGADATEEWWRTLCGVCQELGLRIANDAAYAGLRYGHDYCCLADIAPEFPDLEWVEMFSTSKIIGNGTGWRVGAMVGSREFINDVATIKGNSDSGLVAFAAAGALYALENDKDAIREVADTYKRRSAFLCHLLTGAGLRLAIKPKAGFFILCQAPKFAFGREMADAKDFNLTMINETGVVGVHFGSSYIRYAVASVDVEANAGDIQAALQKANVSY